ncbi:MAG: DUF4330 family protein [Ruminococcaceae bacterium]|nr:DUF4330 family protein [Oscillospiraceae bacterium]
MAKIKEKKKRFNFIDVILLIVILSILASLVYMVILAYNSEFSKNGSSDDDIRYTLRVEGVDNDIMAEVNVGDKVVELDSFTEIGTVAEYYEEPSEYVGYNSEGKAVKSDDPSKTDLIIVIDASGNGKGSTYDVGSYTVSVGKDIAFRVPGFTGEGQCVLVEVKGDE